MIWYTHDENLPYEEQEWPKCAGRRDDTSVTVLIAVKSRFNDRVSYLTGNTDYDGSDYYWDINLDYKSEYNVIAWAYFEDYKPERNDD